MITLPCARCGRALRCPGHDPYRLRCPSCGEETVTPPAIAQRVAAAFVLLQGIDARGRQVSDGQRRELRTLRMVRVVYLVLLVTLAANFGGCGLWMMNVDDTTGAPTTDGMRAWWAAMSFSPAALFLLLGLCGYLVLRARGRRLENACGALPPIAPGEPCSCRACGGPLRVSSASPFARCAYCAADNLTTPDVVARAGHRALASVEGLEDSVRLESAVAHAQGNRAVIALLGAFALAPVAVIVAWGALFVGIAYIEGPADASLRYAVVPAATQSCVAQYFGSKPQGKRLYMSAGDGTNAAASADERTFPLVVASWFVGKRVAMYQHPTDAGRIDAVYQPPFGVPDTYVRVKMDDGRTERLELTNGVCMAGGTARAK